MSESATVQWDSSPFPVVYSTESGDYRRASIQERAAQIAAQTVVTRDTNAWKRDSKPDAADKAWSRYTEFVNMISRSPYPARGVVRQRYGSGRTRRVACDSLLTVVPAGYGKRDGVIEWLCHGFPASVPYGYGCGDADTSSRWLALYLASAPTVGARYGKHTKGAYHGQHRERHHEHHHRS